MTGLVYIFTGEGKGKTSAALGVATRALLLEKRVLWVAFYKQRSWGLSEAKLSERFPKLEMVFAGKGFRIIKPMRQSRDRQLKLARVGSKGQVVVDTASEEEHLAAAAQGLQRAREMLGTRPFLLVLDEILNAVAEGLVKCKDVLALLSERGETHIILTGRGAREEIVAAADLVTECKKIKHPYDVGKLAVAGLDY